MPSCESFETPQSLDRVLDYVDRQYHADFRHYRRRFLNRRIQARMHARSITTHEAYAALLRDDPREYGEFLNALSINVSYFMRDQAAFDALQRQALAPLLRERDLEGGRQLSVWSAGCSRGEEPYSVAMLLVDLLGARCGQWTLALHATDGNEQALMDARRGLYARESFRDPTASFVGRHFRQVDHGYLLNSEIREMVTWSQRDIQAAPLRATYDIILCRNVLIYYVHERQESIVRHLLDHLAPGGYLVLGMVEILPSSHTRRLIPINAKTRLYRLSDASAEITGHKE